MNKWVYKNTKDNRHRFLLGEKGSRTLVCVGVNPSTAIPNKLDNTLTSVKNRALTWGYDSWLMLNIYPQRTTDPNNLHLEIDTDIHNLNIKTISDFLAKTNYDIWAAWGNLIEKRPFLVKCLKDIHSVLNPKCKWVTAGKITNKGHPHHPLYLKKDLPKVDFDVDRYLASHSTTK